MKTYNQFLNTPFSEEIKPPEPQEEDPQIASKEKRQQQIKKMVLLKKLQAVRAGAGADIVASHTPEGELVDETYFDSNTRGVSTKGGLRKQYNKPGKLSQSSFSHERKSKKPELRMSKKELRKSMEDDANYEKKMGRSKPTPSNLKTALKKQSANEEVVNEGIKKAIKKGVRIAKRVAKDATSPYDPGSSSIGSLGNPHLGNEEKRAKERAAKKKVSEGTDKAFEFVKKKIEKEVGKSGYVSKDNPRKPPTAAQKKAAAAHQAKVDAENAAERAKDPSQGRYPKG